MSSIYLPHLVVYIHVVMVTPIHNSLALFQGLLWLHIALHATSDQTGTRELQFPLPPSTIFSFPLPLFSPPVLFCLLSSLPPHPARSTRCSLAFRMVSDPGSLDAVWMVKMQWERVEAMFMGVYIRGWEEEKRNTVGRLRKGSRWRGGEREMGKENEWGSFEVKSTQKNLTPTDLNKNWFLHVHSVS